MSFIKGKISLSTLFVLLAITITGFTAQSQQLSNRRQGTVLEQLEQNSRNNIVDQVINYAYRFRGTPYRYGAMSPRGFDCSGFTSYVFKRFGIELDRSSRGQIFDGVRVKQKDLQPGDIVFFQWCGPRGHRHQGQRGQHFPLHPLGLQQRCDREQEHRVLLQPSLRWRLPRVVKEFTKLKITKHNVRPIAGRTLCFPP